MRCLLGMKRWVQRRHTQVYPLNSKTDHIWIDLLLPSFYLCKQPLSFLLQVFCNIWRLPEMGVPSNHPFSQDFPWIQASILGYHHLWKPPSFTVSFPVPVPVQDRLPGFQKWRTFHFQTFKIFQVEYSNHTLLERLIEVKLLYPCQQIEMQITCVLCIFHGFYNILQDLPSFWLQDFPDNHRPRSRTGNSIKM